MKKVQKGLALVLVAAFALCLLSACSGAEKREYTLPAAVTVTKDDGSRTVVTFSYDGNMVTVKEDGAMLSEDACNDAGLPTVHSYYELGERRGKMTYEYDKEGRQVFVTHEDTTQEYTEEKTTYDGEGRKLESILKNKNGVMERVVYEYGENGSWKKTAYNGNGRFSDAEICTCDGAGRMTEYASFFVNENSASFRRTWEYDAKGLPVRECEYDESGELSVQKVYTYDEQGREILMQRTYGDGTPSFRTETVYASDGSYTASSYDGNGLLYNRSTYGADGKLSEERNYSDGEDSTPIVIAYTYGADGFLTRWVSSYDGAVWKSHEVTETCTVSLTEEAYRFFMTMVERYAF